MNAPRTVRSVICLIPVLTLSLIACGVQVEETHTVAADEGISPASMVASDTPEILAEATELQSGAPTPLAGVPFSLPSSPFEMPLDRVALDSSSVGKLEPFALFTFDMISTFIPDASLASLNGGNSLAAHFDDGALVIWEVASGDVLSMAWSKRGGGHTGSYAALAVSPGSEAILATSATVLLDGAQDLQSAVYLWEAEGLGEPFLLPGTSLYSDRYVEPMGVISLDYSPDGSLLAGGLALGEGGMVRIWDVARAALLREVVVEGAVSGVTFSRDGTMLLITKDSELAYVDTMSGEALRTVEQGYAIHGQTLSPSGDWLALYGDQLTLLDLASGEQTFGLSSDDEMRAVAFSPQESLLAIADGDLLRFWDLNARKEVASYRGDSTFLDVVFLDSENVLATVDEQSRVLLWGVEGS